MNPENPGNPGRTSNFRLRLISSVVIVPPLAFLLWAGGLPFLMLLATIAAIMGYEWSRMTSGQDCDGTAALSDYPAVLTACLACALVAVSWFYSVDFIMAIAVVSTAGLVIASRFAKSARLFWSGLGLMVTVVPVLSIVWLREQPQMPLLTVAWIISLVIMTDIGGYLFGRTIGGPKLAPVLSPKKTWAGLLGGMTAAALVSVGFAVLIGTGNELVLAITGAGLAVAAQIGDLFESAIKRRFGVKDSGNLIPGHGGIWDRVDGQLLVAPMVAGFTAWSGVSPLTLGITDRMGG